MSGVRDRKALPAEDRSDLGGEPRIRGDQRRDRAAVHQDDDRQTAAPEAARGAKIVAAVRHSVDRECGPIDPKPHWRHLDLAPREPRGVRPNSARASRPITTCMSIIARSATVTHGVGRAGLFFATSVADVRGTRSSGWPLCAVGPITPLEARRLDFAFERLAGQFFPLGLLLRGENPHEFFVRAFAKCLDFRERFATSGSIGTLHQRTALSLHGFLNRFRLLLLLRREMERFGHVAVQQHRPLRCCNEICLSRLN